MEYLLRICSPKGKNNSKKRRKKGVIILKPLQFSATVLILDKRNYKSDNSRTLKRKLYHDKI